MVDVLFLSDGYFAAWWLTYPAPLKNDGLRHLGLWHSQLNGKMKFMLKIWKVSWDDEIPNWMESHNPFMFQTTKQFLFL